MFDRVLDKLLTFEILKASLVQTLKKLVVKKIRFSMHIANFGCSVTKKTLKICKYIEFFCEIGLPKKSCYRNQEKINLQNSSKKV